MSAAQKSKQPNSKQPNSKQAKPKQPVELGMNLVVLEGEIATEPTVRELPSGDTLVAFDVRVREAEGPAQSLPVTWISGQGRPKGAVGRLEPGKLELGRRCVVLGAMNRRFYQAKAGGLQSRVDLRAKRIVIDGPAKRQAAITRFLKAVGSLGD